MSQGLDSSFRTTPELDSSIKAILRLVVPHMLGKVAKLGMDRKQELISFLCLLPISSIQSVWVLENGFKEEASSILSVVNLLLG